MNWNIYPSCYGFVCYTCVMKLYKGFVFSYKISVSLHYQNQFCTSISRFSLPLPLLLKLLDMQVISKAFPGMLPLGLAFRGVKMQFKHIHSVVTF